MGALTEAAVGGHVLRPTGHPLQRCGAWAVTLLAGRESPDTVTADDVEKVVGRLVSDVVTAALAAKGSPAYDWWKVLFALYPNSRPTHAKRPRDRAVLVAEVGSLFAADEPRSSLVPCTFCSRPCATLWAKSVMPMFESQRALNTLPPGISGWPVCRACRVALWALPYTAWVTEGSATVLTCSDPSVERAFAVFNRRRGDRVRHLGFTGLPVTAGPEAVVLRALREHAAGTGGSATLWTFKNDNQEPWLRSVSTRLGVVAFLRAVRADPASRRGWSALRRSLRRQNKAGMVIVDGETAVARLLFDREGEQTERLPRALWEQARDPERIFRQTLLDWRAMCRLYLEVMYGMDADRLKPAATLLADWIAQEASRGRFNEFRNAVGNSYSLHKLLMNASARLFLDGKRQERVDELFPQLISDGPQGWRVRGQLFFDVMAELIGRGMQIGKAEMADEDADDAGEFSSVFGDGGDDGEEYS